MLNEINPSIFENKYLHDYEISDADFLLCFSGDRVLLNKSGEDYKIPRKGDFSMNIESPVYLFSINSQHYFGLINSKINHVTFEFQDVFNLHNLKNKELAWIVLVGYQLMIWYDNNKFCGKCGEKTQLKTDERAIICPTCNLTTYPKISPAIIVAITCNNKILLIKGKNYKSRLFTLVAGFVDIGESIEETVVREVKEEVGLDIKNLRYYKSQPWPLSSSLMLGFIAETDDTQTIIIDEKEIEEVGWFARGNLPIKAEGVSISGELIAAFEKCIF